MRLPFIFNPLLLRHVQRSSRRTPKHSLVLESFTALLAATLNGNTFLQRMTLEQTIIPK